jgi:putative transposase
VDPVSGDSFFLVLPFTNTECTHVFLRELSKKTDKDHLLLVCDGASWHKSKKLDIPSNIE